jgi:hypothetical protein
MTGDDGAPQDVGSGDGSGGQPRGEEPGIERVAGTRRVRDDAGPSGNLESHAGSRPARATREQRRTAGSPLDDRERRKVQEGRRIGPAQERGGLGGVGEQEIRRDVSNQRVSGSVTIGEERTR